MIFQLSNFSATCICFFVCFFSEVVFSAIWSFSEIVFSATWSFSEIVFSAIWFFSEVQK